MTTEYKFYKQQEIPLRDNFKISVQLKLSKGRRIEATKNSFFLNVLLKNKLDSL